MKIYCKNCKYINEGKAEKYWARPRRHCSKIIGLISNPYELHKEKIIDYFEKNTENKCEYYVQKWWKFGLRSK